MITPEHLKATPASPLDPQRAIADRDCSKPVEAEGDNLHCR
jgi:hypothetical protein